jgi:RTX calcium-binding nonapeptide repeat (4 copies)
MAIFKITPATSVFTTAVGDSAFHGDTAGADTLIVDPGAVLMAEGFGGTGAFLRFTGAWTVTINGAIVSTQQVGLSLDVGNPAISTITIGADGEVGGREGMNIGSSASINNAGVIAATDDLGVAIILSGGATHTIVNSGVISSPLRAIRDIGSSADKVTNFGTITGDIHLGGGNNTLINLGEITGSGDPSGVILFVNGNDTLSNSGHITGNVINLFDGTNTLTNSGVIDMTSSIAGGTGDDKLSNSGAITGDIELHGGANKLTNTGTIVGDVATDAGNDTIANSKSITGNLVLGDGANSLTNAGILDGFINVGDGNDTIVNAKIITHFVTLSGGSDQLTNSGTINDNGIIGFTSIAAGDGNDIIGNSGRTTGTVELGAGDDKLTNSGSIGVDLGGVSVYGGDGSESISNKGVITGDIDFTVGSTADKLVNAGTVGGDVMFGAGNDTLTDFMIIEMIMKSGKIVGTADLGGGNDSFTGGSFAETVKDGDGADIYKLGGGNDTHVATGHTGSDGNDTVGGGGGVDLYDAHLASNAVQINLDTIAHDETALDSNAVAVAANTATGDNVAGALLKDTITNFENVSGGDAADVIYGSALANALAGSAADDLLFGYAGNDVLEGGSDNDKLFGGLGNDTLNGGGNNDLLVGGAGKDQLTGGSDADIFQWIALSDSPITARDLIADFEQGNDKFDLSAIDADTTNSTGTNDTFAFIGTNVPFTGTPGQLHAFWSAIGQIVEGDVNGDKIADISIEIKDPTHAITLASTDFVL